MDCIFCKIVTQEIPATIIYEDNLVMAFDDLHPQAPVHKLIIPKAHIATVNDLDEGHQLLIGHMVLTAQTLAKELNIAEDGYRLVLNCNPQGGQEVYHIHAHLLGGRTMTWPPG